VATGRELPAFEIEGMPLDYSWCLPSPDGRTLVVSRAGGRDSPVLLLDAVSGKVKQRLKLGLWWPTNSAFSPDGRTLAFVYRGDVLLWEVASGRSRGRLPVPQGNYTLAFSPDGRFLAVGSTDEESPLCLWSLATGQVVGRLRDHHEPVTQLAFSPDGSRLATMGGVTPIVLVCDVAELIGKKKIEEIAKSTAPSAEELKGLWVELSGADGARAYHAIRRLGLSGPRGVAFLKGRLKGDKPPDEQRIARLIADLDDDKFARREKATAELEKLGLRAEPALRRTLEGEASAEARSRVKRLLERLGTLGEPPPAPELIRLRVVEALEANGTQEARQALAELSEHATEEQLRQEAKASLERLSRQPAP
jgi:dipeptidyl aminopeptidase/acylaminoacyl peptidase